MRVLVLLVYTVAATWAALSHSDSAWFVLHGTGALAGLIALSLAITYAGLIGMAAPDSDADQARSYMEKEDWDD
ncbi:hypothetical protein KGD82_13810 [Nocardiopsis eucommiae]|uniref:Uncharacterized protein n=1 Tax=Nocardiopsis eucommiae TaxID=2831970 RepID=A0A975QHK8_9ACTN|nr:hypothetical protein KGD82_13810 [Nocardiopsis eucommiae]